ncbi:hypothetical protein HPP92_004022 [Vanilla planifolia]|uniref:Uncharacterized protein n=1 Tax=Vanilla planifolia TaxID=51239 RepID=A0A835VNT8_VANPL|nr:hypothetical protein HPP92_004022 [Vanilla planifolia]
MLVYLWVPPLFKPTLSPFIRRGTRKKLLTDRRFFRAIIFQIRSASFQQRLWYGIASSSIFYEFCPVSSHFVPVEIYRSGNVVLSRTLDVCNARVKA